MAKQPLIECIPNFSEGRRLDVVDALVTAISGVPDVRVLHRTSDADHNRSVITFAGTPDAVVEAAYQAIAEAAHHIDMTQHHGQHPRIGATDVVPFVPLRDANLTDCVQLAQQLGQRVGHDLKIPVYLYGAAAQRPDRANLADVRRGQYEGLRDSIQHDPARLPDYGPAQLATAGAVAIGAREALIAYNVYLNTDDVSIAKAIAGAVRYSGGGLAGVKALGLLVNGQAQVSMNLTDYKRTPVHRVMEFIRREAQQYGLTVTHSELIGLMPQDALFDAAAWYLQLHHFDAMRVLENALAAADESS